ncbi:EAL domain-containing protein, partial [Bacillus paralicheniformis]|uniref:EAL domain-containing protein n=1 Tax=Bacillus paralicheniformis TaxID=1648923 RepID=UPI0020BEC878
HKACAQQRLWNEAHNLTLRVAVNISPIHISTSSFVDMECEVIAETGIDPYLLEIEITEMSMLDYTEDLIDTIKPLRALGITISLGKQRTGYSS